MKSSLLLSKRFAPLFWTQFLSAFNDNFLKNTLVLLILFQLATDQSAAASLVTFAGALFMAPFLLLSALGGQLADKYDKAWMAERLKLAEVFAALVAVIGLAFSSVYILMAALFLFGVISALFGPIKFGILPDHLERAELPKANGWIEGGTFIAILGGTILAGVAALEGVNVLIFGPLMMALALGCWAVSKMIPSTRRAEPDLEVDRNILRSTWTLVNELRRDSRSWRAGLMAAWFWLVGAVMLSFLPTMVKDLLGGSEIAVTAYLAVFAISIAIGSAIAAWLCAGRVVLLPAPVGTFFMAVFGLDLAWNLSTVTDVTATTTLSEFFASPLAIRVAVDLGGLALFGALLAVPTFTAVQAWAEEHHRARVVAGANILAAGFITFGTLIVAAFQAYGIGLPTLLLGLALTNFAIAGLMFVKLPTNPFRDFITILFGAFLRLDVHGLENVKKAGPAPIIALNHVSLLDGALALALTDEEPIFAVDYVMAEKWWVKPFLKMCDFMPLNPANPLATRTLIKAVKEGKPLVIFPEGRLTVTGSLMKVYDGAAMIADKTGSKVVPVRIEGLEKTHLSYLSEPHVKRELFPKVTATITEPAELQVSEKLRGRKRRIAAGASLYQIMSELVFNTTKKDKTILQQVIETAKEKGMKTVAVEDPLAGPMTYGKLLTGVSVLGRKFKTLFADQVNVGVLLPNANGTVATVLGLMAAGKVPAMMNFTAGENNILSACKSAEVQTILTSKAFVEQAKLEPLIEKISKTVNIVWMEELRETLGIKDKVFGALTKKTVKANRHTDDPAVILFTSGSEGAPKGVVLTHKNILSNTAQAAARIDFHSGDKVFNALPLFHSFGMTAGTILPLTSGVPIYLYPSPLHYRIVPGLIYVTNSTIIFGTDTFLNGYARMAHPYDFRSIRYCFSGAEPVKASTRETFMEKFGIRILEGYGVTETAPVISINTPMYNKTGTVGKIMPGMEYRLEPVPGVDEGGRLFVKGPNVMAGYLFDDKPGVLHPPEDGWHDTGDIVTVDNEGFVTIRGRAKRFAKIGGEMVSLAAIEKLAGELWPGELSAVANVPDPRKGEKLILVTEASAANRKTFMDFAKANGAMDLMIPAEVYQVSNVPVLGSGKVDFAGVKLLVNKLMNQRTVA